MRNTGNYYLNSFIPNPLPPKNPSLILNEEILKLFGEASFELGNLNNIAKGLPDRKRFINAYVIKEALLSSEIEGIHTTLIDVFTEATNGSDKATKETQLVLNYIKALEVAQHLIKNEGLPIVSRVILAAHEALMKGEGDKSSPGEYRKQSVKVGEFFPPPASEVVKLMSDLENYINQNTELPPLIKTGLVHVQFEIIHPFLDGNGRIGRLLIILMFMNSGLLDEPILYPSYYFKRNSAEYYLRLDRVRTHGDFEGWIAFYLTAIEYSCIEASKRAEAIQIQELIFQETINDIDSTQFNKIRDTAKVVLNSLFQTPVFSIKQISIATGKSYNTIHSIITHFVELQWVVATDEKKRNKIYRFDAYLKLLEDTEPKPSLLGRNS
jgi:Fic family protein